MFYHKKLHEDCIEFQEHAFLKSWDMRCFFKQTNGHGKKRDGTTGGCFDVEDSSPRFSQRERKHPVFL